MSQLRLQIKTTTKLLLYFAKPADRRACYTRIIQEQGFGSTLQQYVPDEAVSQENSAGVLRARHRNTGVGVYLKAVYKDVELSTVTELAEVVLL